MSTEEKLVARLRSGTSPETDLRWTVTPIHIEAASAISRLSAEVQELRERADACQQQAEVWKMEAMAHKSSLHEAYQVLTDATGEPGDWNGARPFRDFLHADRDVFAEWLRSWVRDRFGKMIRHETVWDQYRNFDSERRRRARAALKPEIVND